MANVWPIWIFYYCNIPFRRKYQKTKLACRQSSDLYYIYVQNNTPVFACLLVLWGEDKSIRWGANLKARILKTILLVFLLVNRCSDMPSMAGIFWDTSIFKKNIHSLIRMKCLVALKENNLYILFSLFPLGCNPYKVFISLYN